MDLKAHLLKKYTQTNCQAIVDWVGSSQERFDTLFAIFLTEEYRIVQRASGAISFCVEAHPTFIQKNFGKLIKNLQKSPLHDAVKRNTVRLLQYVDIPRQHQGAVMDICFGYVASPNEAVAIKAFSLTVLGNLAKQHPDIIPEIKLLIADQLSHQTAALRIRAREFLKKVDG
jgi:hypothetical protein